MPVMFSIFCQKTKHERQETVVQNVIAFTDNKYATLRCIFLIHEFTLLGNETVKQILS